MSVTLRSFQLGPCIKNLPNPFEGPIDGLIKASLDQLRQLKDDERADALLSQLPLSPVAVEFKGVSFPEPRVVQCEISISGWDAPGEHQIPGFKEDLPASRAFRDNTITLTYDITDHSTAVVDSFEKHLAVWQKWAEALNAAREKMRRDAREVVRTAIDSAITQAIAEETLKSKFIEKFGRKRTPASQA